MARRVSTPTLPFLWARLLHALVIERVEKPEPGRNRVGLGILPRGIQLVCDNRAGQDVARQRTDMLSAPAPYPTVSTENPAPDDTQIESITPKICVDYLSHDWKDEDVWNSWKAMTKRKNEIANGVRLENASWRTWAKHRGKLKTVSPQTLNWLKESDVTWLYGPLHGEAHATPPPKVASTAERLGIDVSSSDRKPILKHRTLTDILQTPLNVSHPKASNQASAQTKFQPSSPGASTKGQQPRKKALKMGSLGHDHTLPSTRRKRHISFNTLVSQCIALDDESIGVSYPESESSDSEDEYEDQTQQHRYLSQNMPLTKRSDRHITIAMMPPTYLKMGHECMTSTDSEVSDEDDDMYGRHTSELDARYSVNDPIPGSHELDIDQDDGYEYYDYDVDDNEDDNPMSLALLGSSGQQGTTP